MECDMDFNAGQVFSGRSVEELGEELFGLLLETLEGYRTKAETMEMHEIGIPRLCNYV